MATTNKRALVTGVTGQDGSYLVELLLEKGYDVHGIVRRTSAYNRQRIEKTREEAQKKGQVFDLHYGDLSDSSNLHQIIAKVRPDELYNMAAQSHVQVSFSTPEYTADVDGVGVLRLLEGIRNNGLETRFYQASTSELYGKVHEIPQTEETPFHPRSPYGVAKIYGYWITKNYRESYNMHASNGILFNHESPRRGENFVTRKITLTLSKIQAGTLDTLWMGNMDAKRDWGYAPDYVEAMWLMLQQDQPDDYVVATGETHTVREFIELAAPYAGFDIVWEGTGTEEVGRDRKTGKEIVKIDPKFYRPAEVDILIGDPAKARKQLKWEPKVTFPKLVEIMMKADLDLIGSKTA